MTQPVFGHDLACIQDSDLSQSEVDGVIGVAQALLRRLQTPNGTLLGDADYGYDLLGEIDDEMSLGDVARIGSQIDGEFLKDQRVTASNTDATFGNGVLVTSSQVTTANGPFTMTLGVSQVIALLGLVPSS